MRRLRTTVLPIVILCFFVSPSLGARGTADGEDSRPIEITEGRIDYFEGDVTVNGEAAELGMRVVTGDLVETGLGSVADIVFGERNLFRLSEDTSARLTFEPERQGTRLEKGAFSAVFDELVTTGNGTDDRFTLETNTTVAGVRGTTFFVKVESETSTFVCTCHGSLSLRPR